MMTLLYALGIPLLVYVVATKIARKHHLKSNQMLLFGACALFSLSLFLPSPSIHGENTEFVTHLLGGGVFTGLLWVYFRPMYKRQAWYGELLQLFVLVSTLGVANELLELFLFETHLTNKPLNDTSWDLLANTLGVVLFYGVYWLARSNRRL